MHASILEHIGLKSPRTERSASAPEITLECEQDAEQQTQPKSPKSSHSPSHHGGKKSPLSGGTSGEESDGEPRGRRSSFIGNLFGSRSRSQSPAPGHEGEPTPRRQTSPWLSPRIRRKSGWMSPRSSVTEGVEGEDTHRRTSFLEGFFDSITRGLSTAIEDLIKMADDYHVGMSFGDGKEFDFGMEETDLHMDRAFSIGGDGLLLNHYTREQTEKIILSHTKLAAKLAAEGFTHLSVTLDTTSPNVHKILMRDKGEHTIYPPANNPIPQYVNVQLENRVYDKDQGVLLMELALRVVESFDGLKGLAEPHRDIRTTKFLDNLRSWENINILVGEWLLLQNPTRRFGPGEQPLPGQSYPGLHVGKIIADIIFELAKERGRDGVVNAPLYFHNAVLYAMHGCQYINPELEGIFNTLGADLMPLITDPKVGLAVVSRAIYGGRLFHIPSGKRVKWVPGQTQVRPLSDRMKDAMRCIEYGQIRDAFTSSGVFRLDLDDPGFACEQDWEDAVRLEAIDPREGGKKSGDATGQDANCHVN